MELDNMFQNIPVNQSDTTQDGNRVSSPILPQSLGNEYSFFRACISNAPAIIQPDSHFVCLPLKLGLTKPVHNGTVAFPV